MTARRRGRSGRTTPKGTKGPTAKSAPKPGPSRPPTRPDLRADRVDKSRRWVSRPETHHRGNR